MKCGAGLSEKGTNQARQEARYFLYKMIPSIRWFSFFGKTFLQGWGCNFRVLLLTNLPHLRSSVRQMRIVSGPSEYRYLYMGREKARASAAWGVDASKWA